MAPTTLLAEQHYINLKNYFPDYKESIALLTGSTKAKEKEKIKNGLSSGSIRLVIGTHALFQDDVSFLILVILLLMSNTDLVLIRDYPYDQKILKPPLYLINLL